MSKKEIHVFYQLITEKQKGDLLSELLLYLWERDSAEAEEIMDKVGIMYEIHE